jgi:hypothetical protein
MRYIFSIVFLLAYVSRGNSQIPQWSWATAVTGPGSQGAFNIALDSAGSVYSAGYFIQQTDFDPGPDTAFLQPSDDRDMYLLKQNGDGEFKWVVGFDAGFFFLSNALCTDANGNIFLAGTYDDTVDFNPGIGVDYLYPNTNGIPNGFILKLDSSGNFLWIKDFVGPIDISSIALNSNGELYYGGYADPSVDLNPDAGAFHVDSVDQCGKWFIAKLGTNDEFVWANYFSGCPSNPTAMPWYKFAIDKFDNLLLALNNDNTSGIAYGLDTLAIPANASFITKLDSSGDFIWSTVVGDYNTSVPSIALDDIEVDASGNVYTTGVFYDSVDFDPTTNEYLLQSTGNYNSYIQKHDANGNFQWVVKVGSEDIDQTISMSVDAPGNVYATGVFNGLVDFDPGPGTYALSGSYSMYVLGLDSGGNFNWCLNPTGGIFGIDIALRNSSMFICGEFGSACQFGPIELNTSATAINNDAFVVTAISCDTPPFGINTSSPLCYNGLTEAAVALPSTPSFSMLWNTGDTTQIIQNIPAGYYSITITSDDGCSFSDSVVIVQPSALTTVVVSSNDTQGNPNCNGSANVTASGAIQPYNYIWSDGNTYNLIEGLCEGWYVVTVADANGCTTIDSVYVASIVSAPNANIDNPFSMFPNPADEAVILSAPQLNDGIIQIVDQFGRTLVTTTFQAGYTVIQTSKLAEGSYIVCVSTDSGRFRYKLQVVHN